MSGKANLLEFKNNKLQREKQWQKEKVQEIEIWQKEIAKEERELDILRLQIHRRKEILSKKETSLVQMAKANLNEKNRIEEEIKALEEL